MQHEVFLKEISDSQVEGVLSYSPRSDVGNTIQLPVIGTVSGIKIKQWGANNNLPAERDKLLGDNNIIGELISTKRDIILGQGIYAYKEEYVDGKKKIIEMALPEEIADWMEDCGFMDVIDECCLSLVKHANYFVEYILDAKNRVSSVMHMDCKHMRAEEKKNGTINRYIHKVSWSRNKKEDGGYTIIPAYKKDMKAKKFILHVSDNTFNDGYYGHPAYWGGKDWIRTSNNIPKFHDHNMENGYSFRFIVKYPEGYFLDKYEWEQNKNNPDKHADLLNKESAAKQQFIEKFNMLFAGHKGAGKALFIEEVVDAFTKEYKGITIEPIAYDRGDDALLNLYDKTNVAVITGQGIHPTLANVESSGKLSSGSEMRNAFLFYVITKTPRPRRLLMKAFKLICKLNGWDVKYKGIKFGFEDMTITKLDDNKDGKAPVNDQTNDPNA